MIKEIEVLQPEQIIKERHVYCDVCEKEIIPSHHARHCEYCGKDLCSGCVEYKETSDYSLYCCKTCWDLGTSDREKIKSLEEEIERIEVDLEKRCREKRNER